MSRDHDVALSPQRSSSSSLTICKINRLRSGRIARPVSKVWVPWTQIHLENHHSREQGNVKPYRVARHSSPRSAFYIGIMNTMNCRQRTATCLVVALLPAAVMLPTRHTQQNTRNRPRPPCSGHEKGWVLTSNRDSEYMPGSESHSCLSLFILSEQ